MAEQEQGQPNDGAARLHECDVVIRHGYVMTMNSGREIYADGAMALRLGDRGLSGSRRPGETAYIM